MVDGGDPFYRKFWVKLTALERKNVFSDLQECLHRFSCFSVQMVIAVLNLM